MIYFAEVDLKAFKNMLKKLKISENKTQFLASLVICFQVSGSFVAPC